MSSLLRAVETNASNARAFYQVMRDRKLPRSELDRLVHRRLKRVLVSAYSEVPYYRELMQSAGYDPVRDYRGPADLARLPTTDSQTFKRLEVGMYTAKGADLSRCHVFATSGTTGQPLKVYRNRWERSIQMARWIRSLIANGYSLRHRAMALVRPAAAQAGPILAQRMGFGRRLGVSYFHHSIEEIVDIFLDYNPDVLQATRSYLEFMALELRRRGLRPRGLKLVTGTGEVIEERHRELFRTYFGLELVETYGTVEMGTMAWDTCERDGLSLAEDLTFFEFLNDGGNGVGPGELGRVVVTDLTAILMPFIRYDLGDRAAFENRAVDGDSSRRKITRIIGRDSDYAVLPDGSRLSHHGFILIMQEYDQIEQFRVVQQALGQFRILVAADAGYLRSIQDQLVARLQPGFPQEVRLEIVHVDRIEPDPSGKMRVLVSEVGL